MIPKICAILALSILLFSCGNKKQPETEIRGEDVVELKVTSPAFKEGDMIPAKYTADGPNVSPPLSWSPVPEGTKSLALICDDPDAPMGTWVHWVIYNLPPSTTGLPENVPPDEALEGGGRHGVADFGRYGYGGPAPPSGTHRYFFKIYALDAELYLAGRVTKKDLLTAMEGHVLAQGQLMGRYQRQ